MSTLTVHGYPGCRQRDSGYVGDHTRHCFQHDIWISVRVSPQHVHCMQLWSLSHKCSSFHLITPVPSLAITTTILPLSLHLSVTRVTKTTCCRVDPHHLTIAFTMLSEQLWETHSHVYCNFKCSCGSFLTDVPGCKMIMGQSLSGYHSGHITTVSSPVYNSVTTCG